MIWSNRGDERVYYWNGWTEDKDNKAMKDADEPVPEVNYGYWNPYFGGWTPPVKELTAEQKKEKKAYEDIIKAWDK